ncbi:hypothetical protein [Paenibacillus silagei]|uniref:XRE family transcriptional regulator n=1 Tax=Paenibacillus silagei TaxID=1670801 RepID=A0ABS4NTS8_9BACL|nr:hypothetical protein [Paenibacillus silagei]MBP2113445.1 hypothetical protein [Paenibacillus silagei]
MIKGGRKNPGRAIQERLARALDIQSSLLAEDYIDYEVGQEDYQWEDKKPIPNLHDLSVVNPMRTIDEKWLNEEQQNKITEFARFLIYQDKHKG